MTEPYPILPSGRLAELGIRQTAVGPQVPVGTRGYLPDGRVYRFARNSGIAIVAGQMLQSELISDDFDNLATNAAAVNDGTVEVTPVGTKTYAVDELKGGFLTIDSGTTGAGLCYRIKGNPATSAATAFRVVLGERIAVALHADATATVMKNPWMDVVIAASGQALVDAGVANIAIGAGSSTKQYFWAQTWGPASVWHDAATATGSSVVSGGTSGQVEAPDAFGEMPVGQNLFTAAVGNYGPVNLRIAS